MKKGVIMSYKCISVDEAEALLKIEGATLLDIRDPASFANGSIGNAINLNNENVEQIIERADKEKPVIIYCYHGNSSKNAADYFFHQGFTDSYSVDGGYQQWALTRL